MRVNFITLLLSDGELIPPKGGTTNHVKRTFFMSLNKFCADYWKQDKFHTKNQPCNEIDLFSLLKSHQSGELSQEASETLMRYVLCKNGKVRRLWREICRYINNQFVFSYYQDPEAVQERIKQTKDYCVCIFKYEVEKCLKGFDLTRPDPLTNENVMKLLSGYISQSLHFRDLIQILTGDIIKDDNQERVGVDPDHIPDSHQSADDAFVRQETLGRAKQDYKLLIEKARQKRRKIDAFIKESRAGLKRKSNLARQQKRRLKKFIESNPPDNPETEIKNISPDYIVDAIESWLEKGEI